MESVETTAGLQVPVNPLVETNGNESAVAPTQYGPADARIGVILSVTVTVRVSVVAQKLLSGVKI